MKPLRTKQQKQRAHCIQRAKERYGLVLNRDSFDRICHALRRRGRKIGKKSGRFYVLELLDGPLELYAIWDRSTNQPVTFITKAMAGSHGPVSKTKT